jgi:hypothetical protein
MIADLFLRWIVTALFLLSATECVFAVVTGTRVWWQVVGQMLHVAMAVAMVVMAWPAGAALPTAPPMVFFLLAALWFAVITFAQSGHRLVNAYHVLMMLAMAWMYAVMSGALVAQPPEGVDAAPSMGGHHGMPGMNMPDADPAATLANPPFITGLNWLWAIGFAAAAVWWLYRYFVQRKAEPSQPSHRFLGTAAQAMMAVGMAIMFGVML